MDIVTIDAFTESQCRICLMIADNVNIKSRKNVGCAKQMEVLSTPPTSDCLIYPICWLMTTFTWVCCLTCA